MATSSHFKLTAGALILAVGFLCTIGCQPQAIHPNQANAFDGTTYDSLTLAHAVLISLRSPVAQDYGRYTPAFNDSVTAYNDALAAYTLYRQSQNEGEVASSLRTLALSLVLLETSLQSELHVPPGKDATIRAQALHIRSRAARANITVSDILAELQIAASIAETIPAAQPYYPLAQVIIRATTFAVQTEEAEAGKPIDLLTIPVLVPIV